MKKRMMILIIGVAAALFATQSMAYDLMGVDIHGFVSQGYLSTTKNNFVHDTKSGTFEFDEVGINFSKAMTDKLRVGIQFFARDLGDFGNNQVKIDWAYADYRFKDWLGLRFGQMKSPHGLYNETRDVDMLRTFIFLPQSVYQEIMRDVTLSIQGGGLYGNIDMNALGWLNYQALYGTQTIDPNTRMGEALVGFPSDWHENDSFEVDDKYAGNVIWDTPLNGLRLGVSYDNIRMKLNGHWNRDLVPGQIEDGLATSMTYNKYSNLVYSLEYTFRDFMIMGEYIQTRKEFDTDLVGKADTDTTGWYVGAAYRFSSWFELGSYYSETEHGYKQVGTLPQLPDYYWEYNDACVTARFDINEFWTFKLEGHSIKGAYGLSAWDNPETVFYTWDNFKKNWTMFAAKMTVNF